MTIWLAADESFNKRVGITRLLRIVPTLAYAKGEHYSGGPRSPDLVGRTGGWYFCTDRIVAGNRLNDHLSFLVRQVVPDPQRIEPLRLLLRRKLLRAVVTCFWHGPAEARRPSIPRVVTERLKLLPAEVETDFDQDERESRHAA